MTDEDIEAQVDAVFVRLFGRTFKEGEEKPPAETASAEGDSLERIIQDYPSLFGEKP